MFLGIVAIIFVSLCFSVKWQNLSSNLLFVSVDFLVWKTSSYLETALCLMTSTLTSTILGLFTSTQEFFSSSILPWQLYSRQDIMHHPTRYFYCTSAENVNIWYLCFSILISWTKNSICFYFFFYFKIKLQKAEEDSSQRKTTSCSTVKDILFYLHSWHFLNLFLFPRIFPHSSRELCVVRNLLWFIYINMELCNKLIACCKL